MKTIRNKTHDPIKVPLPRGKVLHLGPFKTGEIAAHAEDHPPLKALIDAEKLELEDEGAHTAAQVGNRGSVHAETHGHVPGKTVQRTGDR